MEVLMNFKIVVLCLSLIGCATNKPQPIIPYQIPLNPIDLSAYKNMMPVFIDDQLCYSEENFIKQIQLLNKLKDYTQYQQTIIREMDNYYNPKHNPKDKPSSVDNH